MDPKRRFGKTRSVEMGKGAQRAVTNGLKGAKRSISKTLDDYKSLPDKGLVLSTTRRLGNPLALPPREAASVEMLAQSIPCVPQGNQSPLCPIPKPNLNISDGIQLHPTFVGGNSMASDPTKFTFSGEQL